MDKKKVNFFSEYTDSRFIRSFAVKAVVFLAVLFGVNLLIMLWFRHTSFFDNYLRIPEEFYFPVLSGLSKGKILNAFIFTAVIFIIYIRKKIPNLKEFPFNRNQAVLFSVIAVLFLVSQYLFKYWIRMNLDYALSVSFTVTLLKYFLNIGFVVMLALAVFGLDFVKYFVKSFYKELLAFGAIFLVYWGLVELFQMAWVLLSTAVARSVGFLLGLTFRDVVVNPVTPHGPQVGVSSFAPYVSAECSGIDSLQLFISIFAFLLVLDWTTINRKKMYAIFIPGVIATFLFNIFRVYLIMLVGIFINPEFAIDVFHTNIGWILFLVFFFVFWTIGSKYVYGKKAAPGNHK